MCSENKNGRPKPPVLRIFIEQKSDSPAARVEGHQRDSDNHRADVQLAPFARDKTANHQGSKANHNAGNDVQTLIEWIDEHIDQPLNIEAVAKKSGYSKWYLQRMFRTVTRQTLGDYIRQRRLLLAAVELRTTERPIFDIAMDLGYVSQQTFSRVFRREFDRTPSDYRHRL